MTHEPWRTTVFLSPKLDSNMNKVYKFLRQDTSNIPYLNYFNNQLYGLNEIKKFKNTEVLSLTIYMLHF